MSCVPWTSPPRRCGRSSEACRSLRRYAARVTLLHVLEIPSKVELIAEMGVPLHEYVARKAYAAHERLAAAIPSDARAWCHVQEVVRPGRPAPVILEEADAHKADLIVMGSQGHHGLSLALLGSATQTVVRGASCPVLTAGSAIASSTAVPDRCEQCEMP